eukprot:15448094-Alexandrium_andersonii.AAC.1
MVAMCYCSLSPTSIHVRPPDARVRAQGGTLYMGHDCCIPRSARCSGCGVRVEGERIRSWMLQQ